jgi:transcriptional regulator with XRE-family HTH domain
MMKNRKSPDHRDAFVGSRIRSQRLVRRMSQTELGRRVGVTFQQVQKYEKGRNRVSASRLQRISDVLAVPVAFFFGDGAESKNASAAAETGLAFLETAGAVRLVRAYSKIRDSITRRSLVELAETMAREAGGRKAGRASGRAAN